MGCTVLVLSTICSRGRTLGCSRSRPALPAAASAPVAAVKLQSPGLTTQAAAFEALQCGPTCQAVRILHLTQFDTRRSHAPQAITLTLRSRQPLGMPTSDNKNDGKKGIKAHSCWSDMSASTSWLSGGRNAPRYACMKSFVHQEGVTLQSGTEPRAPSTVDKKRL